MTTPAMRLPTTLSLLTSETDMAFILAFETDNAAFDDAPEIETRSILLHVAKMVAHGNVAGVVHDTNGNKIGRWHFDCEREEEDDE